MADSKPDKKLRQYVEDVALAFEAMGLPRMMGRVFGWLLIADPPEQTFAELTEALGASKGSISTATRGLIQGKLIERASIPGQRRDIYRVRQGGWAEILRQRQSMTTQMRLLAERGLALLDDAAPERKKYLAEMHSLYAFFEREMPALIDRWEKEFFDET
jgi:DNA-binding MarR family transcriptional regulator